MRMSFPSLEQTTDRERLIGIANRPKEQERKKRRKKKKGGKKEAKLKEGRHWGMRNVDKKVDDVGVELCLEKKDSEQGE